LSPEAGESRDLSQSCQQRFAQLNTNTLFTSLLLHRQNTMTYATIHTGTHETRAKNDGQVNRPLERGLSHRFESEEGLFFRYAAPRAERMTKI
jgi:hypothetical protein